jgi:hypothetical protein
MSKFTVENTNAKTSYHFDQLLSDDLANEIKAKIGQVFHHVIRHKDGGLSIAFARRCGGERRIKGLELFDIESIEQILAKHEITKEIPDEE